MADTAREGRRSCHPWHAVAGTIVRHIPDQILGRNMAAAPAFVDGARYMSLELRGQSWGSVEHTEMMEAADGAHYLNSYVDGCGGRSSCRQPDLVRDPWLQMAQQRLKKQKAQAMDCCLLWAYSQTLQETASAYEWSLPCRVDLSESLDQRGRV